jgi:hypothetical protein
MHQMNLYEAKTGIVIKEQMVAEKENELTRVKDFLTPLLLQGRLISADALILSGMCVSRSLLQEETICSLSSKINPPCIRICRSFFTNLLSIVAIGAPPQPATKDMGVWKTVSFGSRAALNDFLARDWYGVEQVFCLRRRVEHALKCTQQIVYGITSLTRHPGWSL